MVCRTLFLVWSVLPLPILLLLFFILQLCLFLLHIFGKECRGMIRHKGQPSNNP